MMSSVPVWSEKWELVGRKSPDSYHERSEIGDRREKQKIFNKKSRSQRTRPYLLVTGCLLIIWRKHIDYQSISLDENRLTISRLHWGPGNANTEQHFIINEPYRTSFNCTAVRNARDLHTRSIVIALVTEWAAMAQVSLRICTDAPESSLLAYTKYGCRWSIRPKFRHLTSLDNSALTFIWGICAYAESIGISCAAPPPPCHFLDSQADPGFLEMGII